MIFVIFACANTFYILDTALDFENEKSDVRILGKDFFYTFVFTYLTSIGDIRDEKLDHLIDNSQSKDAAKTLFQLSLATENTNTEKASNPMT